MSQPDQPTGEAGKYKGQCASGQTPFDIVTRIIEIVIGAFVGVVLVVVGFMQYRVYRQQAAIMRVQNSAWVNIQRISTWEEDRGASDIFYHFQGLFKNTGSTLAKVKFAHINYLTSPTRLPNDYDFHNLAGGTNLHGFLLNPQSEIGGDASEVAQSFLDDVREQKKFFYIYGTIIYDDTIGKDHVTMFCAELAGSTYQVTMNGMRYSGFNFRPCDRHNCVNEDCENEPRAGLSEPR